ncbi:hypothetical protein [Abyssalbus ytuae]|uniref:Uncharacterized protein n=1 Tax=Abyssalbus ytuae TaxID=2926907 RepID=A0A9E6ZKA2_9FLAO|nr:hypothetical protein [Abyssalbus ytuae]UOB17237.1 hypothetical protein MQE35_16060 [Abyssalbus ytuae]
MDIQSRKIEFIQEFLKIQSEEAISRLETLLRKERENTNSEEFSPMTEEQLNKRIEQSELDFKNNRFKSSAELLTKFK